MEPGDRVTVLEAARRFEVAGDDLYRALFAGELIGGRDCDASVYVSVASIASWLADHPERVAG